MARFAASGGDDRAWLALAAEAKRPRPESATNVGLTHAGLVALGLSEATLGTFPEEFRDGMGSPRRSRILGDSEASHPGTWEVGGTAAPALHAILVLHAASESVRANVVARERARIAECAGVSELAETAQEGHRPASEGALRFSRRHRAAEDDRPRGHGRRHRRVHSRLPEPLRIRGARSASPRGGRSASFPDDDNPHHRHGAYRDLGLYGSYLVYRKLQQDVAGFWQLMLREAERLKQRPDPGYAVVLASKLVGRWPTGAPLTLARERTTLASATRTASATLATTRRGRAVRSARTSVE